MQEQLEPTLQTPAHDHATCPACQTVIVETQKECFACGIVFANYGKHIFEKELRQKISGIDHVDSLTLLDLDHKWKQVVVNYHDHKQHQTFIDSCVKAQAIPYAVYNYSRMIEIDGRDEIAQEMRKDALLYLSASFATTPAAEKPIHKPVIPLLKWIIWFGILTSMTLIVAGVLTAPLRNLIGLGVSLLFIFLVAHIYRLRYLS